MTAQTVENTVVRANALRRFCAEAFERTGVPDEDAAIAADTLVEADLRGVHSHGTWWLKTYIQRLQQGGLNPRPNIQVIRETPAMALLDADRAMGQVAGVQAMRLAMQKAKTSGVGVVTVRNSNHFGAAAYYQYITKSDKRVARGKLDNGTNAKQVLDEMGQEQGKTFEGEPKDVSARTIVAQGKPDVAQGHVGI